MSFIQWAKWWFWDARRCNHEPGEWRMINFGMGKARHCKKCGKCLDLI